MGGVEGEGICVSLGGSEVVGGRFTETCCSGGELDFGSVSSGSVVVEVEVSSSMADVGSGSLEIECTSDSLLLATAIDRLYGSSDGSAWTKSVNSGSTARSAGLTGETGPVSDNDCREDTPAIEGGF